MGVCRTICQLHMRRYTSQSDMVSGSHEDSTGSYRLAARLSMMAEAYFKNANYEERQKASLEQV